MRSQRHKAWNMVKIDLISILKIIPNVKSAKRNRVHKSKTTVLHRKRWWQKKVYPDSQAKPLSWQNMESSVFWNRAANSISKKVIAGTKGQKSNQNKGANDKN